MKFALVGMALRFPGGITDETAFWNALQARKDLISRIDGRRWPVDELQHPLAAEPGRSVTFEAGVLPDVEQFDAGFFGISPREAALMDPQQRLLLELTWEALENAGTRPSSLRGSDTGVFVGISGVDYGMRSLDDLAVMDAHSMTGNTLSIAANRISYVFDLHGPSMAVDTACSSSLVALHQACNSLRLGESSLAIVGGVNLLLHPYPFVGFTKASMLSPQGRCRAFDAAGNGYVRSEGGAVLLLKRLEEAEAAGDHIHAVILGTGVNADGARKTGLTIPSVEGQAELMSQVLRQAAVDPADLDYLEAHGTGTAVGDPVEAQAIGQVYGMKRTRGPLPIGSVKTNLGHLEPASGMAGLIKAILVLKHGEIPAMLHQEARNTQIAFDAFNIEPVSEERSLPVTPGRLPLAGVNSFGFGGANAHVLLQAATTNETDASSKEISRPPLRLSAHTEVSLRALAAEYAERLRDRPDRFYDIAYGACFRRETLPLRLLIQEDDPLEVAQALEAVSQGEEDQRVVFEQALPEIAKVAFVYAGNGAQWHGMARVMLEESPVFAETMGRLDALIAERAGFSVIEEIHSEADVSRLADTEVAQPVLFAIQVALTEVLREQGVESQAVAGHSVGEVAAAWAAGLLTLDEAVEVICQRSAAQGQTRGQGRMAAVALAENKLRERLQHGFPQLEIAGINSVNNCTVSGPEESIRALAEQLDDEGVFCRVLDLDYAFHSRFMDAIRDPLQKMLEGFTPSGKAKIPFVSTVTGDVLDQPLDAEYWWRNVRQPVVFAKAVETLIGTGCRIFVEIAPHPILQHYLRETLEATATEGRVLSVMRRDADGLQILCETTRRVLALDEDRLARHFPEQGRWIDLPTYVWDHNAYWLPRTREALGLFDRYREHPLLGWRMPGVDPAWENILDPQSCRWLADHVVDGAVVFPGAAYAEMALAAASLWQGGETGVEFEELDIVSPMVFEAGQSRQLRFEINARDGGFRILGRQRLGEDDWQLHAIGRLPGAFDKAPEPPVWERTGSPETIEAEHHYRLTAQVALEYGPAFQGLARSQLWPGEKLLEGALVLPVALREQLADYHLHPALLDVCFQALIDFFAEQIALGQGMPFVPVRIGRLRLLCPAEALAGFTLKVHRMGLRSLRAEIVLHDAQGAPVAWLEDCRFQAVPLHQARQASPSCWQNVSVLCPLEIEQSRAAVPVPAELATIVSSVLTDEGALQAVREYLPLLEGLTLALVGQAMRDLMQQRPDDFRRWCEAPDVAEPALRELFSWALLRLQEEKLIVKEGDDWHLVEHDLPPPASVWEILLREYAQGLPELALLGLAGTRLPSLLLGRENRDRLAGELLANAHWSQWHDTAPVFASLVAALETLISHCHRQLPAGRRLRVLEINAGGQALGRQARRVGEAIDHVVAVVAGLSDSAAGEDGQAMGTWVPGGALSLPGDAPSHFDLVVVRGVTAWLDGQAEDLRVLHDLLAPGGLLVLADRFSDDAIRLFDLLVAQDAHTVADSVVRSPEHWLGVLRHAGFEGAEVVRQDQELSLGGWLLLARRPHATEEQSVRPEPLRWWLVDDTADGAFLAELCGHLERAGQSAHRVDAPTALSSAGADDQLVVVFDHLDSSPDEAAMNRLLGCVQGLAGRTAPPRLWVITRGGEAVAGVSAAGGDIRPAGGAIWGLARVAMNEHAELALRLVDLDPSLARKQAVEQLARELLYGDDADEVLLGSAGRRLVSMQAVDVVTRPAAQDARFRLDFLVPGQLRNLLWLARPDVPAIEANAVEVEVIATGLNFRDVMYAMGMLPDEAVEKGFAGASLGLEFAGRVTRVGESVERFVPGDNVMGFGSACFGSHVVTREDALAHKPAGWSFEQAATVPTVFFTVYYALQHLARLQPGERVLIHGAAGGVGIAAIQLARHLGAEVHATAGSEEKRAFVRLLGADYVYDSRSLAFADEILANTGGEGVDVVLNSLAGEAIRRNLRILRPFGRFLELGKRDFFENTPVGLRPFKDNISYFGIDADQLLVSRPELAGRLFRELMDLFDEGALFPLPCQVFDASRIVEAFRTMQQARHIGKIVVRMADQKLPVQAAPGEARRVRLREDASYLITGGLSGFGLASARWLAQRGAGELILVGRRGGETPGVEEAIDALQALGAKVTVKACDVGDATAVAELIDEIGRDCLPLAGVLHAAMVIDDDFITRLDPERLHRVMAPKAWGAWHLHQATCDLVLDHFILFSSITTFIGNPGQANYVAANAWLDSLASMRRAQGLPATCIGWGPIGDAGYLTRNEAVRDSLEAHLGAPPLSAQRALSMLDYLLEQDAPAVTGVADFAWPTLARYLPASQGARYAWLRRHRGEGVCEDESDFRQRIAGKNEEEVASLVREVIVREIAAILGLSEDRVDPSRPLREMGLDSLMGAELVVALESQVGIRLPMMVLTQSPSVDSVVEHLVARLLGGDEDTGSGDAAAVDDIVAEMAGQHAVEGEAIDLDELSRQVRQTAKEQKYEGT